MARRAYRGCQGPVNRGHVLITTYRLADQDAVPLDIQIVRIDRPVLQTPAPQTPAPQSTREIASPAPAKDPGGGEVNLEIVLHIEPIGDRRYPGGEWIGGRGQGRRVEAFSVRPLEKLRATDVDCEG